MHPTALRMFPNGVSTRVLATCEAFVSQGDAVIVPAVARIDDRPYVLTECPAFVPGNQCAERVGQKPKLIFPEAVACE